MDKRVLYVDLESFDEHLTINLNCISSLKLNNDLVVSYVFKKGYHQKLGLNNDQVIEVPLEFYPKVVINNGLINRFHILKRLFYLKNSINFNSYDIVFFSCYEEITFFIANLPCNVFLLNHNNVAGIDSFIKKQILRLVSKRNIMLVFEEYMKVEFVKIGIKNVFIAKHGLPKPFKKLNSSYSFAKKYGFEYNHIVFSPSSSSSDNFFLESLTKNERFIQILKDNKVLFLLKNSTLKSTNENIIVIKEYMSDIDYTSVFLESSFILLPYSKHFSYRVSNVLNECIINNKLCLMSNIKPFTEYSIYFKHFYVYNSINDFCYSFVQLLNSSEQIKENYINIRQLENNLNTIIK